MAADVQVKFGGDFSELKNSLSAMEGEVRTWGANIRTIAVGAFAFFGGKELIETGVEFIQAAREAAEVDAKLQAVLEATGHAAGFTASELDQVAKGLQQITQFDDDAIKGAQTMLATFTNVRTAEFERATKLALDMATIMGGDAKSAAETLGKALDAPIQGLQLLGRSGVRFTEQQQEMIEAMVRSGDIVGAQNALLDKLTGTVGGAAEAAGDASGSGFTQLRNIINDTKEAIGGGLLVVIDELLPLIRAGAETVLGWAESFQKLGPAIADSVALWMDRLDAAGELVGSVFGFIFDVGVQAFAGIQKIAIGVFTALYVAWEELPAVAQLAWDSIHLGAVSLFNDIAFFFTDTVPTLLEFFADNWREIFTDVYNFTATVVTNMFDNLVEFFQSVWEWLNGNEASFEFKGLTEGFESSLKELPVIAERELTALEKTLQQRVGQNSLGLFGRFQSELEMNLAAAGFGPLARPDASRAPVGERTPMPGNERQRENFAPQESDSDEFKSSIEDASSLFKRIQTAAASGGSAEAKAAEKAAAAGERAAAAGEKGAVATLDVVAELREIKGVLKDGPSLVLG